MKSLIWGIIACLLPVISYSQGCSDAGFCTMGAMRPDQNFNRESLIKLRAIGLNLYRGKTTLTPVIYAATLDIIIGIDTRNTIQVKLPHMWISGNLTEFENNETVTGLGDISLSFTRNIIQNKNYDVNATIGMKIPSNNADLESAGGIDYHMYYQTSLGTYDIILGGALISEKWMLATGFQAPVSHQNQNDFRIDEWGEYGDQEYLLQHNKQTIGTELRRGSDIMLRIERNFRFSNYSFNIGLLPIYRIIPDKEYFPNSGNIRAIDGTTGLALSALAGGTYHFDINSSVKFMYGRKITQRDYNPDGLTRHDVYSFSYVYKF